MASSRSTTERASSSILQSRSKSAQGSPSSQHARASRHLERRRPASSNSSHHWGRTISWKMAPTRTQRAKTNRRRARIIAARIREHRELLGITQTTLASWIGVTHAVVQRAEAGYRPPSPESLARYAAALGVSVADLSAWT